LSFLSPLDIRHLSPDTPCPCGSGKLVGNCHTGGFIVKDKFYPVEGRNILSAVMGQDRFWVVGTRVFRYPARLTFHELLFNYLADNLNRNWIVKEGRKGSQHQHHIFKCYQAYEKLMAEARAGRTSNGDVFVVKPNGATNSLLTLAYDLYQMEHSGSPPPKSWLKKLRDRHEYQGVRYEILVAAIFCRMGFKLDFLERVKTKHCEFIASHKDYPSIAVEAKSRRRSGILHEPGEFDFVKAIKGDVQRLYEDALTHVPESGPFVVFIDLNAPATASDFPEKQWYKDVRKIMHIRPATPEDPDLFSQLAITNFSFHYDDKAEVPRSEYVLIDSYHPRFRLPHEFVEHLRTAIDHYSEVPPLPI
jgi:hypothetical protein